LDSNKSGSIEINEVKARFNAARHPDVIAGLKTVEEARFSFFEMFTTFHNATTGFSGQTTISFEEFLEYHLYLNEQFDRDTEFRNFLVGVWNMDVQQVDRAIAGVKPEVYGKNSREHWKMVNHNVLFGQPTIVSHEVRTQNGRQKLNPALMQPAGTSSWNTAQEKGGVVIGEMQVRKNQAAEQSRGGVPYVTEEELVNRVKARLRERGTTGINGLYRSFALIDQDKSGKLEKKDLAKVLTSYRISTDPKEHEAIFSRFDKDAFGAINYEEFLRGMTSGLNDRRKALVMKAFRMMDREGNGYLDKMDLKQIFNARMHPDVLTKRRSEDEVTSEFLDTFENSFGASGKNRNGKVNENEWIDYFTGISAGIDNDEYFDVMMTNTWGLDKKPVQKAWAGDL
jgi:calcyphosin